MREAEVLAALTEAEIFESVRDAVLDELRGVGSQLIKFLGGKSRLRGVLGADDIHFRYTSQGLMIELSGGHIEIRLDGMDTVTVEFFKKGKTPHSGKRVKKFGNVSLDRLVSVLKKHSQLVQ